MAIDTVRISKSGRDQLLTLKRRTKIPTWNILCRWAFCVSVAEPTAPHSLAGESEGALEISLDTLFGNHVGIYLALLRAKCKHDGLSLNDETLNVQLRLHLHRGIAYLAGMKDIGSIRDLCAIAIPPKALQDKAARGTRKAVA